MTQLLKELGREDWIDRTLGVDLPTYPHHVLYPRVTVDFIRKQKRLDPLPPEVLEDLEVKKDKLFYDYCVSKGLDVPPLSEVSALRREGIMLQADIDNGRIVRVDISDLTLSEPTYTVSPDLQEQESDE